MGIPLVFWLVGGILLATGGGYVANSARNDSNDLSPEECVTLQLSMISGDDDAVGEYASYCD